MRLNRNGSVWTRNERIKLNDNWDTLDDFITSNGETLFDSESFNRWLESNSFKPKDAVETYSKLPSNPELKEIRGVIDENSVYVFDGKSWVKQSEINFDGLSLIKKDSFYSEIEIKKLRDDTSKTSYWLIEIPYKDTEDNVIEIKKGLPTTNNALVGETPRKFFEKTGASFVINASVFDANGLKGRHIKDGEIIKDSNPEYLSVMALTENRDMIIYPPTTTAQEMLNDGVINSWTGFYPFIEDFSPTLTSTYSGTGNTLQKNPRTAVGIKQDKTLIFLVTDGRKKNEEGMTYEDLVRIYLELGVETAYCLDGGGSSQAVLNGNFIGGLIDNNSTSERNVYDFIYVKKPTDKELESSTRTLSELSTRVKRIENKYVSEDNPEFDNRATFNDHMYLKNSKAIYGTALNEGGVARLLGRYDDRVYLGDPRYPLSLFSLSDVTLNVDGLSNTLSMFPNNPVWISPTLLNGWTGEEVRKPGYIKVSHQVTIRGWFIGTNTGSSNPLFTLPSGYRPSQQLLFSVPTLGAEENNNTVVIYPNGNVVVQYALHGTSNKLGVHIDITFTTL